MLDHIRKRVRLRCDLTEYDSRLVAGSLGHTTGRDGTWGMMISYDCGAYLDTLGTSLEYVDAKCPGPDDPEGYRKWREARLRKATKISVYVGPRGGFQYMRYAIGKQEVTIYDRYWASQELDALLAVGKRPTEYWPDGRKTKPTDRCHTPLREAWERADKKLKAAATAALEQPIPAGAGIF